MFCSDFIWWGLRCEADQGRAARQAMTDTIAEVGQLLPGRLGLQRLPQQLGGAVLQARSRRLAPGVDRR